MITFEMDWWKKKKKKEQKKEAILQRQRGSMLLEDIIKCCDGKSNPIKFFSADAILKATNNFSKSNHFSVFRSYRCDWYSGINHNYSMMLIKKYYWGFYRDVAISSMVSGHKNFMKFLGCCLDLESPITVYYGEKQYSKVDLEKIVSWKRRMKIAEDIATALAYLHTAFSTPFVYRIMDIENIFIEEDGVAKLTDFSACISIPQGQTFVEVEIVAGTWGYVDVECIARRIVSEKTDAYGFGILMLMLLRGGNKKFCEVAPKDLMAPRLVSKFIEEDGLVDEIVDPNMLEDMGEVTNEERFNMNAFLSLSMRCIGLKGEVPTMVDVTKELKNIQRSSQTAASSVPPMVEVAKELKNVQISSSSLKIS